MPEIMHLGLSTPHNLGIILKNSVNSVERRRHQPRILLV